MPEIITPKEKELNKTNNLDPQPSSVPKKNIKNKYFLTIGIGILISSLILGTFLVFRNYNIYNINRFFPDNSDVKSTQSLESSFKPDKYTKSGLVSRAWVEYTMDIVRANKPTPPESARLYAYSSSVFSDVFKVRKSVITASQATQQILNQISAKDKENTDQFTSYLVNKNETKMNIEEQRILDTYLSKEAKDGFHTLKWDGIIPQGSGKWVQTTTPPFAPTAGEWDRWIIDKDKDYNVPPPFLPGTKAYNLEIQKVNDTLAKRTPEQVAEVNFWGGGPGTEAPSGIWQNRLYSEVKDKNLTEEDYGETQSILAKGIADSFMALWRIKYQYWTERPSMAIPGISLAMPNPNFPGYVSGHSTISSTASEILGNIFPDKKDIFFKNAMAARNSRINAGVHFEMDNAEGFILGAKVGQDVLKKVGKIKVTDNTVPNLTGNLNGELKEKVEIGSVVQSSDEIGHLYSASNPSITDKKILFISKQDKNTVKPSDGWTLEEVGVDSYWQKGAYGLLPTTIISNRYIVTIVGTYSPETSTSKTELVYYDLKTGQFNNFFKNGEQQDIQSSIDKVSDDTFGYFYYPPNSFNLDTNTLKDKFIYRREVSLPNLAFKDYKIAIPQEFFQSQNSNFGLQEIGGKKYLYKQNYNQNTGLPTDTIYSKFNNNMFEKPVTIPDSNNAENIILGGQDVFLVKNLDLDKGEVSIFQKDKLFLSYPLIKNNLSGRIMAEDDDNIFVEIIPKLQASFRGTQIQVINKKTKEITGILKNDYKIVADNNPDSDPNSYVVAFDVAGVGIYK